MLEKLYIRCENEGKGCEAVVSLEKLQRHEKQCLALKMEALTKENGELKEKISLLEAQIKAMANQNQQNGKNQGVNQNKNGQNGNRRQLSNEKPAKPVLYEEPVEVCGYARYRTVHDRQWAKDKWLVDSIASCYMTLDETIFNQYQKFPRPKKVELMMGGYLDALGIGSARMKVDNKEIVLRNILLVPQLEVNLLCLFEFGGFDCSREASSCIMKDGPFKNVHFKCVKDNSGLSYLQCTPIKGSRN